MGTGRPRSTRSRSRPAFDLDMSTATGSRVFTGSAPQPLHFPMVVSIQSTTSNLRFRGAAAMLGTQICLPGCRAVGGLVAR